MKPLLLLLVVVVSLLLLLLSLLLLKNLKKNRVSFSESRSQRLLVNFTFGSAFVGWILDIFI